MQLTLKYLLSTHANYVFRFNFAPIYLILEEEAIVGLYFNIKKRELYLESDFRVVSKFSKNMDFCKISEKFEFISRGTLL